MGQMNMMGFYQQQGMQMPGYYPMMAYMTPEQQQQAAQAYAAAGYGAYTGYPGYAGYPGMNPAMPTQQAYGGMQAAATASGQVAAGLPDGGGGATASSAEVENFIANNRLDATAAQNLRAEPAHIQRTVIDRGSLAECVNPSSAVIGRIRDAKLDAKYGRPGAGAPVAGGGSLAVSPSMPHPILDGRYATPQEVEQFIVDSKSDDGAARAIRAEPPQVQTAVINRGSLSECLNPSSAVIGRIRDAKMQVKYPDRVPGVAAAIPTASVGGGGGGVGEASGEVEQFIRENHLDDGAAKALRAAAPEVQSEVVNRGTLLDCTNPSSAVMGRIREAKQARGGAGVGGYGPTSTAPLLRSSPY